VSSTVATLHANANLRDLQVLVVEDSWHVANALKALLEELGVKVTGPAATPSEAERLRATRKPDVAIVDINRRGEMASGLIDRLNEHGVRVVVISGYAIPQVAQSKVAAVLQKPFSAKALLAILRQASTASEAQ
jgi:CheY-like chemotaxis protein